MSGGGLYVRLGADEGFTYTIAFGKKGKSPVKVTGAAPLMTATVKIPQGIRHGRHRDSSSSRPRPTRRGRAR